MVKFISEKAEALVKCNGSPLPEYIDPDMPDDEQKGIVTRYIELIPNAEFTLHFQVAEDYQFPNSSLSAAFYVDGLSAVSSSLRPKSLKGREERRQRQVDGFFDKHPVTNRVIGVRSFVFSKIEFLLTDAGEDSLERECAIDPRSLGKIEIKVFRIKLLENSLHFGLKAGTPPVKSLKMSEKRLKGKALSHSTKAGQSRSLDHQGFLKMKYLDYRNGEKTPIMTFRFLYRSHGELQIMGLIPREAVLSPPGAARSSEEMQSYIAELEAENIKLKVKIEPRNEAKRKFKADFGGDEGEDGDVKSLFTRSARDAKRYKGQGTVGQAISFEDE
ncbi:MAG: hypothetical protein M1814_003537 [Vezdaea aestivalis]|nr:MAG: hypothetical protein M1814_003537 [Vezdaea aestivalis]